MSGRFLNNLPPEEIARILRTKATMVRALRGMR
jgi:hypothetical protein